LITYRINVSAAGYKMVNFTIVSASITTITVQMTSLSTTNLTGFQAWQDTEYLVSPNSGFYNTSQTLSFQVANNASTLDSWGMFIVKTNGSTSTVVFNSTSTVATGGTMTYVANPNATYTVYANFKRQGDNKYNIMPVVYHISTQSVGLAAIRDSLAGGNVISGWTFYFIASCISIGIGLAIYRFSGGSSVSAIGGVASLFFFSYLAPPDMYLFGSFVTPMMATITIAVGTIAAVYVTSNG